MATLSAGDVSRAKKLYEKQELGAPSIARILGVSTGAVYYALRRSGIKRRSFAEENALRFNRKQPSFRVKQGLCGRDELLKIAGTMLYWAEGFQSEAAKGIDFANSKPEMMIIFVSFLRKICGIDESKLRVFLYCYANQDIPKLISFWSKLLKVPKNHFTKPYIRRDFDNAKIDKMLYGLAHIRYHDKKLLNIVRLWIKRYTRVFARR